MSHPLDAASERTIETFQKLQPLVVAYMETICDKGTKEWSSDSLLDAKDLLLANTGSDFIASLAVTNGCLGYVGL